MVEVAAMAARVAVVEVVVAEKVAVAVVVLTPVVLVSNFICIYFVLIR